MQDTGRKEGDEKTGITSVSRAVRKMKTIVDDELCDGGKLSCVGLVPQGAKDGLFSEVMTRWKGRSDLLPKSP